MLLGHLLVHREAAIAGVPELLRAERDELPEHRAEDLVGEGVGGAGAGRAGAVGDRGERANGARGVGDRVVEEAAGGLRGSVGGAPGPAVAEPVTERVVALGPERVRRSGHLVVVVGRHPSRLPGRDPLDAALRPPHEARILGAPQKALEAGLAVGERVEGAFVLGGDVLAPEDVVARNRVEGDRRDDAEEAHRAERGVEELVAIAAELVDLAAPVDEAERDHRVLDGVANGAAARSGEEEAGDGLVGDAAEVGERQAARVELREQGSAPRRGARRIARIDAEVTARLDGDLAGRVVEGDGAVAIEHHVEVGAAGAARDGRVGEDRAGHRVGRAADAEPPPVAAGAAHEQGDLVLRRRVEEAVVGARDRARERVEVRRSHRKSARVARR